MPSGAPRSFLAQLAVPEGHRLAGEADGDAALVVEGDRLRLPAVAEGFAVDRRRPYRMPERQNEIMIGASATLEFADHEQALVAGRDDARRFRIDAHRDRFVVEKQAGEASAISIVD